MVSSASVAMEMALLSIAWEAYGSGNTVASTWLKMSIDAAVL